MADIEDFVLAECREFVSRSLTIELNEIHFDTEQQRDIFIYALVAYFENNCTTSLSEFFRDPLFAKNQCTFCYGFFDSSRMDDFNEALASVLRQEEQVLCALERMISDS